MKKQIARDELKQALARFKPTLPQRLILKQMMTIIQYSPELPANNGTKEKNEHKSAG